MPYHHYFMEHAKQGTLILNPEILYTGLVSDSPQWFNTCHQHDFCEILYVADGMGNAVVGGTGYALQKGDLVIYNPGVLHQEESSRTDPLVLMFLGLQDFSIPGLPPCCLLPEGQPPVLSCAEYSYKMDLYFRELIQESSAQIDCYEQITNSLVAAILVLIVRLICITPDEQHALSAECQKIKEYLDENYTSPITLGQLSETVYISKHYLSHMFKEQTGISPIRYITAKRISTACDLLKSTRLSITEVSRKVGYENPLYFSQVFKKMKGISPGEYRNRHR